MKRILLKSRWGALIAVAALLLGFAPLGISASAASTAPSVSTGGPVAAPSGGIAPNFWSVAVSPATGNRYYSDYKNNAIWVLPAGQSQMTEIVSMTTLNTICGASSEYLYQLSWFNGKVYFGCGGYNAKIFSIPDTTTTALQPSGITTVFSASNAGAGCNIIGHDGSDTNGSVFGVALDKAGNIWFTDDYETQNLFEVPAGTTDGSCHVFQNVGGASFTAAETYVNWITIGDSGNIYLTADYGAGGTKMVKFDPATATSSVYASNLCGSPAQGTEQVIAPPGLHDTLFLDCSGGSVYEIPQNADGTAGTPTAVADLSAHGSFGIEGFCNGIIEGVGLDTYYVSAIGIQSDMCVPEQVHVATSGTNATVSWTQTPLSGATSYTVTASTGQTCTATAPATTCTVKGLALGKAVTFAVTATYPSGTSAPSTASLQVTPTSTKAPKKPVTTVSTSTASLASTGLNVSMLAMVAGVLLSIGGGLVIARRRAHRA